MLRMPYKVKEYEEISELYEEHSDEDSHEGQESKRKSLRKINKYENSKMDPKCIICNNDKYEKGRLVTVQMMTFSKNKTHLAENKLFQFANLHKNQNTKHADAAERILLIYAEKSLFVADVGYHRSCYLNFRGSNWERRTSDDTLPISNESYNKNLLPMDFLNLVQLHILNRSEIYTLVQLRKFYDEMSNENNKVLSRSIDIKKMIIDKFGELIQFCKPSCSGKTVTEYVMSSEKNLIPNAISELITGNGFSSSVMIRNVSQKISSEIQLRNKRPYPPTPQDIVNSDDNVCNDLYNLIALIACPKSRINEKGIVTLSDSKSLKVNKICQDIESLVPGSSPSFGQILLSLNLHRKTGSKIVVNDIYQLGHGISYTETQFIQDKWAEWSKQQSSYIPANIKKHQIATHVVDNIDWKNKDLRGTETHHTNSIIIQHDIGDDNGNNAVALQGNYEFKRKDHRSYKGSEIDLPEINFKRSVPKFLEISENNFKITKSESHKSSLKTLLWIYFRLSNGSEPSNQCIPGWSGFQDLTCDKTSPVNIGYLPSITAPPTEMKVIYAVIQRTLNIMYELQTPFIFLEVDQAIYTKIIDAMFQLEHDGSTVFDKIIPRMGGFHIVLCMVRTIYSRFKHAGIVELLSSAGLGGKGKIINALKGGDIDEAIHIFKILFEALMRYKINFLSTTMPDINHIPLSEINKENVTPFINDITILPKLKGMMSQWMDLLLEMIDMLLNIIHFQRTGNWNGFIEIIYKFLTFCFSMNRQNYARNMSYYLCHMLEIKEKNPVAFSYMMNGKFTGSITGKPHSMIPMDQIIETSINRSSKEMGGLSGKTENRGGNEKWTLINHHMSELRDCLNKKIRKKQKSYHPDLGNKKKIRDEEKVVCVLNCFENWVPHMWEDTQPLINIATGEIATQVMVQEMQNTICRGQIARDNFFKRLQPGINESNDESKSYYDPIPKQSITIFAPVKSKKNKNVIIPVDEGQSFAEILFIFEGKKLDLMSIMHWPVTSKPWAIINEDMKSRNNQKSSFRNMLQLQSPKPFSSSIPPDIHVSVVDAMRIVRMISIKKLEPSTFKSWTIEFLNYIKMLPGYTVHIVFDNYDYKFDIPVKNRASGVSRMITNIDQQLPNENEWSDFLSNSNNKSQLIDLIVKYILGDEYNMNKEIYVNNGDICYHKKVGSDTIAMFDPLYSKHREADQKIIFHTMFETDKEKNVCIVSDDSDVFFLLLYFSYQFKSLVYFRQGKTKDKTGINYHEITPLAEHFGYEICNILPAYHVLTGCDYTLPFFGRTKFTCFKKVLTNPDYTDLIQSLNTNVVNIEKVIQFILRVIYNRPKTEKSPGEARYKMLFVGKKKKYASTKAIIPDESTLSMKIRRAHFVTNLMINCLNSTFTPPNPEQYGWKKIDKEWSPIWYEGNPLPLVSENIIDEEMHNDTVMEIDTFETDQETDIDTSDDEWPLSEMSENGSDID